MAIVGKPDVSADLKATIEYTYYAISPMLYLQLVLTMLQAIVEYFKPDVLVGAVGRAPGCFTKEVVEAMVAVQAPYP